ncbi:MAG: hypothetical protein AUG89_01355 [Acidobacteria bacterium 13_1_20CM_4_56_7]|nr:MAG: hypothetical protein AUG89_01355 [Acidobacteria bacterium 13_1_20CM_4_56_7]
MTAPGLARDAGGAGTVRRVQMDREHPAQTLTRNDGLEVVAVALDRRTRIGRIRDCSHLVHAVYDRAGFSYPREFYSFLRHGPGVDEYDARYWKRRGPVRFYRYIKDGSSGDDERP